MKVLLIKDVYKLGHAGDIKRVASGYGRNYLIPQGLAVLATPGAIKQADYIRKKASENRAIMNEEMAAVAEQLAAVQLTFSARAGETGKLYGSITTKKVADTLQEKTGLNIDRKQLDMQPLRSLGEHVVPVRLTMDLVPEIKVSVLREGEAEPSLPIEPESDESEVAAVEAQGQEEINAEHSDEGDNTEKAADVE